MQGRSRSCLIIRCLQSHSVWWCMLFGWHQHTGADRPSKYSMSVLVFTAHCATVEMLKHERLPHMSVTTQYSAAKQITPHLLSVFLSLFETFKQEFHFIPRLNNITGYAAFTCDSIRFKRGNHHCPYASMNPLRRHGCSAIHPLVGSAASRVSK